LAGSYQQRYCRGALHQRAGSEKLPAYRLRQAGSLDPARTRALRRQPRRCELACATGKLAVATGGRVERSRGRGRRCLRGCEIKGNCGVWRGSLVQRPYHPTAGAPTHRVLCDEWVCAPSHLSQEQPGAAVVEQFPALITRLLLLPVPILAVIL